VNTEKVIHKAACRDCDSDAFNQDDMADEQANYCRYRYDYNRYYQQKHGKLLSRRSHYSTWHTEIEANILLLAFWFALA
jgi:hypothetical protein